VAAHTVELANTLVESILLTDPAGVQTADTTPATSLQSTTLSDVSLSDQS
jgi:hypothetical protein